MRVEPSKISIKVTNKVYRPGTPFGVRQANESKKEKRARRSKNVKTDDVLQNLKKKKQIDFQNSFLIP